MNLEDTLFDLNVEDEKEEVRESYVRAPFGWPGGKTRSLKYILDKLPVKKIWNEVFGGSGVVSLNRPLSILNVFNDRYSGIVAFYRCIRDHDKLEKLIQRLELTVHSREEFIWCKESWDKIEDDVERAARWYYLTMTSFALIGRSFGRSTNSVAPLKVHEHLPLFNHAHLIFKNYQIENLDWKQCLLDYDTYETVHYLDPPYVNCDQGIYRLNFDLHDHVNMLETIQQRKGFIALSGFDCELYDSYKWDHKYSWEVYYSIKGMAFTETNNKAHLKNTVQEKGSGYESLWIKESK